MTNVDLVVVLAAGEGSRMKSGLAKVLHPILGVPILGHVLRETKGLSPARTVVVVGHQRERVQNYLTVAAPAVITAVQEEQNGTGHAVRCALAAAGLDPHQDATVLVTAGDTPLLTTSTLRALYDTHITTGAAATVLSARVADPTGYGRIVRTQAGEVLAIVEHKDASAEQLQITEINSGVFVFSLRDLVASLAKITTNNAQGEEYLTDVLGILREDGKTIAAHIADDADDTHGINDRVQLAAAAKHMQRRINSSHMRNGVSMDDPETTWIAPDVRIGQDATMRANTSLLGNTTVGSFAVIGPDTTLQDCQVDESAQVIRSHCQGAHIGTGANVGPFTYLRPGAVLAAGAKAGAYVEIKNANVGAGSKVPHLSYVGDATIGAGSNIGAATVFVNYDGVHKHRTTVGDGVRIGSDTMLVAPVEIGDGAYTAAGSVITEDVPAGSLGVGRARQRNIDGWVHMRRPDTAAESAAAATRNDSQEPNE